MIKIPNNVLRSFEKLFDIKNKSLEYFKGGDESSDGIIYKYPYDARERLLKIMVFSHGNKALGLKYLESRLDFVRYLGENGAHIIFPSYSPQDKLFEIIESGGLIWTAYSMEIAEGESRGNKTWDIDFFRNWGKAIGKIHFLTKEYTPISFEANSERDDEILTWKEEWQSFSEMISDRQVKTKWLEIKKDFEELPTDRDSFGFIHNDPHIWNTLDNGSHVTLLDFDVANHHWFINDFAIASQNNLIYFSGGFNGPIRDIDKLIKFLEIFYDGYSQENELSREWFKKMDLFINYRRILLFTVMSDWIKSQADLYKTWKELILNPPELIGNKIF